MDENKTMQAERKEPARRGFFGKLFSKARMRVTAMVMALASMLSLSCFAADGDPASSGFSAVWSSFDDLGTLMSKVWSMMTANPLLTIMLAVMLLGVGTRVIRMLMRTARGH